MAAIVKYKRPPKPRTISQVATATTPQPKSKSAETSPTKTGQVPRLKARPKRKKPKRPTEKMKGETTKKKDPRQEALSLVAEAALLVPETSTAASAVKGALAGAAIGGKLGLAIEKYREGKGGKKAKPAKKSQGKGKKAKLSQEAVSKPHAKPTKPKKKEESV